MSWIKEQNVLCRFFCTTAVEICTPQGILAVENWEYAVDEAAAIATAT